MFSDQYLVQKNSLKPLSYTDEIINECSTITNLTLLEDNNIAYATHYNGIKIMDSIEHKTLFKILSKELRVSMSAVCFSPDGTLFAFANDNLISILHLKTKQIIKTIKTSKEIVTSLTFCSDYIIAGTHRGRVLQYRHDNAALLARVCSFPYIYTKVKENYVSSFAVEENLLACSGKGGAIFVIDIFTQASRTVLLEKGERIDALAFLDNNKLVSANVSGKVIVFDIESQVQLCSIDAPFSKITQVVKMPNSNFIALVAKESSYIAIADITKAKIVHSKYIEFQSNINKILLANEKSVIVALENNKIINITLPNTFALRQLLIDNNIEEAYALAEDELMLHDSGEYKLLEKRYKSIYKEALSALMNQNIILAHKILSILSSVKSKQKHIAELYVAFEHYNRFKVVYLEKKFALAYAMSEKYEALKLTPLYKKLEETYKEHFIDSIRHIQMGKDTNAKALMNEYLTVTSKQPIIRLLLSKDKDFMHFLKAIKDKNFQILEELQIKNPVFIQAPTYFALGQSIEKNILKIETLINEGKLERAQSLLLKFKNTSFINKELKRLYTNLDYMQKLQKAYEDNNFKRCYELLDTHHPLNITPLGIILNKHWAKLMRTCEDYALKANPKGIKDALSDLLLVRTRKRKIGDLLRVSFQSKIKAYLAKKSFVSAKNIIYSYIDIFGKDNEITSLMKMYELMSKTKLAITLSQEGKDRDMWMYSEFIVDPA